MLQLTQIKSISILQFLMRGLNKQSLENNGTERKIMREKVNVKIRDNYYVSGNIVMINKDNETVVEIQTSSPLHTNFRSIHEKIIEFMKGS